MMLFMMLRGEERDIKQLDKVKLSCGLRKFPDCFGRVNLIQSKFSQLTNASHHQSKNSAYEAGKRHSFPFPSFS